MLQLSEELRSFRGDPEEREAFNVTSAPVILHTTCHAGQSDVKAILGHHIEAKQVYLLFITIAISSDSVTKGSPIGVSWSSDLLSLEK